jgi:hypothetical protein
MLAGDATARSLIGIAAAGSVAIVAAHRTAAPNICLRISFSFFARLPCPKNSRPGRKLRPISVGTDIYFLSECLFRSVSGRAPRQCGDSIGAETDQRGWIARTNSGIWLKNAWRWRKKDRIRRVLRRVLCLPTYQASGESATGRTRNARDLDTSPMPRSEVGIGLDHARSWGQIESVDWRHLAT